MGATKLNIFTPSEKEIALIGRAIAHPARIRILHLLKDRPYVRNTDLIKELELCKKTVYDHLKKLEDAGLVKSDFFWNSYFISKTDGVEEIVVKFLTE